MNIIEKTVLAVLVGSASIGAPLGGAALADTRSATIIPYGGDAAPPVSCIGHAATGTLDNLAPTICAVLDRPSGWRPIRLPVTEEK